MSAISPTGSAGHTSPGAADGLAGALKSDGLGRDAFLKLLVTQLQHQDPTQPKEDGEFLQQLATFSSLEKLTDISSSIDTIGALLLSGVPTTGATQTGGSEQPAGSTGKAGGS